MAFVMSPDTVPDVIHDAAQRPSGRERSGIVDNSAAVASMDVNKLLHTSAMDRPKAEKHILPSVVTSFIVPDATTRSRSDVPQPSRLILRSPGHVAAPAKMSKRTPPQRGLGIRSTSGRPGEGDRSRRQRTGDGMDNASSPVAGVTPEVFSTLTHYGAIDWGREKNELCVVDPAGRIVLEQEINNSPEAWADLRAKLGALKAPDGSAGVVGFAIETNCGPAVERLLEAGVPVFPLNPKAAERFRDRKAPAGGKSDRFDAFCFADALRTDGHGWRPLRPQDPLTHELRLLVPGRDHSHRATHRPGQPAPSRVARVLLHGHRRLR
jgi:hypothetical protein